jgi:hypothetical protein
MPSASQPLAVIKIVFKMCAQTVLIQHELTVVQYTTATVTVTVTVTDVGVTQHNVPHSQQ